MGNTVEQDIKVRIDAIINGLPGVKTFVDGLKQVKAHGNTKVNVDTAHAEGGLKRLGELFRVLSSSAVIAEGPLGGTASRLRAIGTEAGELGHLAGPVGLLFGALVAGGGAAAITIFELAKKAAEAGDEIFRVHQKTNFAVETISGLKNLVKDTGGDFNGLSTSLGIFEKNVEAVNQGDKEMGRVFKALNIDVRDNETALRSAFKSLFELKDGNQQTALAMKIFGRAGQDVLGIVKESNGNLDLAIDKYREMGTLISGPAAQQAHEFSLKLKEVEDRFEAVTRTVGERFMPTVTGALDAVSSALDTNKDHVKTWADDVIAIFSFAATQIGTILKGVALVMEDVRTLGQDFAKFSAARPGQQGTTQFTLLGQQYKLDRFGRPEPVEDPRFNDPNLFQKFDETGEFAVPGVVDTKEKAARLKIAGSDGHKGGGGAKQKSLPSVAESIFAVDRAAAESAFNLFKDELQRQSKALQEQLAHRQLSIKQFYAQELKLQVDTLDKELQNLGSQRIAEQQKLALKLEELKNDKSITNEEERRRKIQIETNKTHTELIKLDEKVVVAHRNRGQAAVDLKAQEADAFEALRKQFVQLDEEAAQFEGLQSIDAIIEKFRALAETLRTEIANPNASDTLKQSLPEQLDIVNKLVSAEIERTRVENLLAAAAQKNALIEADMDLILAKHSGNVLEEVRARLLIRPLVAEQIVNLQAALDAAQRMSESQQDPKTIEALKRQIAALEEMKRRYKDVGREIKDTFFNALEGGVENLILSLNDIVAGTLSIADAFRAMAISVIQELERIIAKMIAMKLIEMALQIFGGGGGGSGDVSGGLGGLFGGAFAAGGPVFARPGGRIIQVAEGGHDEMVVTTDPRHALRSARLLGRFIRRTGILPQFTSHAAGDWISSIGNISFPRLAMGDFVSADGPALQPGMNFSGNLTVPLVFPNVKDYRSFKQNETAMKRDAGRAIQSGIDALRGKR